MKNLLALILLAALASAQTVPPTMFGLNLHPQVVANRNSIPWPSIPFGALRFWGTQTTWNDLNPSEGTYNFAEMDAWFSLASKNGMNDFLYTFGETPAWAASQSANKGCDHYPTSCNAPKDLNADGTGADQYWKNFVTAIVKHANGRIKYWEVWNEPDIGPNPQAKGEWAGTNAQLVRMAKDAYAIIKANCTTCQVLSPCPVDAGGGRSIASWLPAYAKAGGLQYADIIAFHGYIDPASGQKPEVEAAKVSTIRAVTSKPIWDTEGNSGMNSATPNASLQAAYLARMYIVQLSLGVQRFYWWQYGNTEMGTLWEQTDAFVLANTTTGNITINSLLTQAGIAYAQLYKWIVGNTVTKSCMNSGTVWSCSFRTPSGAQSIVWDAGQTCTASSCGQTMWSYPATYTSSTSLAGVTTKLSGGKVAIGAEPILLK